jgi:integrase
VRKPQPLPIAWTIAELRAILAACQLVPGVFRRTGARRAAYLVALVLAAYESGLRRSDLWGLTRGQIRPDGTIVLRQRKTGAPHQPRLRPETAALVLALPGDRPLACPESKPTRFYRLWATVIAAAQVRPGCLQQLRRSGATHLASAHPEAVQRYLGHSSPEMQRHYVDWSIARPQQWLPPALE